tara:strand:- start:46 stop:342 length:297 start_codon:yes stop_codon:yes gene_type:complete
MLSLLLAYFGKGKIPDGIRLALFLFGLSIFLYRLHRLRQANQNLREAGLIQEEIERRQQAEINQLENQNQTGSHPTQPSTNVEVQHQNLSGAFLGLRG